MVSIETALTVITDNIYNNMDKRNISLLTLCELSKAFDSVNYQVFLRKCLNIKVDSFWFHSYLQNRTQSVRIKTVTSSKKEVGYGVPQDSILVPIWFNIFVNDLSTYVNNGLLIQYADDTQFLHEGSIDELESLIHNTQITLKNVKNYFLRNGSKKTQCIYIGNRQLLTPNPLNTDIKLDDEIIIPTSYVKKKLGVYFDRYMLFGRHVNEVTRKVVGNLKHINCVSPSLYKPSRISLVQTLVLSIINY